jgi:hypothetical protein
MSKLTQVQLNQMIAVGGVDAIAAKHIIHLQKAIDVASRIIGEKQIEGDLLKDFVRDCASGQCEDTAASAVLIADELG